MKRLLIYICVISILLITGCKKKTNAQVSAKNKSAEFDESLLKLTNIEDNVVCSPLAIKSMLKVLEDSTDGNSKKQISIQLGDFKYPSNTNDENMSLTNGFFIKDSYESSIKEEYTKLLKEKYNSELIVDSFENPESINKWVSDNTFNMINDAFDDVSDNDFILVNTLAIDLDWINTVKNDFSFSPIHTTDSCHAWVSDYSINGAEWVEFENIKDIVKGLDFACVANKYDLLNVIGEDKIRETVKGDYAYWRDHYAYKDEYFEKYYPEPDIYIEKYINELKEDQYKYGFFNSSTDFSYYVDNSVKVFSKDLKEHNGTNLQYVAIMPKDMSLKSYINSLKIKDVYSYISSLVSPSYDVYEEGYVTRIHGFIPEFDFASSLDLKDTLNKMYINDIFDPACSNLTPISDSNPFITSFSNKVNITLSNEGIKAASLVSAGGMGAGGPEYDYYYELPVIDIDLEFNKPFVFFIIDKTTNDIWFEGTVYTPSVYKF